MAGTGTMVRFALAFGLHPRVGTGALANRLRSRGVLSRGATASGSVDASKWIKHPRAADYEVHEDSFRGRRRQRPEPAPRENETMILDLTQS